MQIIEDAAVHEQYSRVITPEPAMNEETEDVCALLQQCLDIRQATLFLSSTYLLLHLRRVLFLHSAACGGIISG